MWGGPEKRGADAAGLLKQRHPRAEAEAGRECPLGRSPKSTACPNDVHLRQFLSFRHLPDAAGPRASSCGSLARCSRRCASSSARARSPRTSSERRWPISRCSGWTPRAAPPRPRPPYERSRLRRRGRERPCHRRPASYQPPCAPCATSVARRVAHSPPRRTRPACAVDGTRTQPATHAAALSRSRYAAADAAALRPAVALHPLRRRPARRRGRAARRRGRRGAARAVRPRHGQRRLGGDRRGRAARRARGARGGDLRRRRRARRAARTAHPRLQHRPRRAAADGAPGGVPRRPRAAHAAHGRRAGRVRLRARPKPRSRSGSRRGNRSAARTSPAAVLDRARQRRSDSRRRTSTTSAR